MHAFDRKMTECIDACLECHKVCLAMAMTHCLETGGAHVKPQHFRMMFDCAVICATAADFMMHKSQFQREMCALCGNICEACATDCEKLDGMEECVDACIACAKACAAMARAD
jgi:hypothetical protein